MEKQKLDWRGVLAPDSRILGGIIDVVEDGYVYRSKIERAALEETRVVLTLEWTVRAPAEERDLAPTGAWEQWHNPSLTLQVEQNPVRREGEWFHVQLERGFCVIFPKGCKGMLPSFFEHPIMIAA